MGTLLIAVGLNSPDGIAAALYYAVQSTLTSAGLFLLAGLLVRDGHEHIPFARAAPPATHATTLAGLFFLLAIAMVGMPPLAGFMGKLLILDAGRTAAQTAILWPVILGTSLFLILGFARAGIAIFWAAKPPEQDSPHALPFRPMPVGVIAALLVAMVGITIFAGPIMSDMSATAAQLLDPQLYIRAVLQAVPVTTAMGQ
jgi:multicomponent K+:H+ antiporter subunit D